MVAGKNRQILKTYRFYLFHADRDYGLTGFWYVEDHVIFAHGYGPGLFTAVKRYLLNIPHALRMIRVYRR